MTVFKEQLRLLMSPLMPGRIKTRAQGGKQLSYVEAYDIKATLIRVFGFGGFSADVTESRILEVRTGYTHHDHVYLSGDKKGQHKTPQVLALATVRLTIHDWDVTYTESAVGANSSWDIGDAADNAIKTAASDALKRCATYLGSQFGLSLYDDGKNYELIRQIFQPTQAKMLQEIREEWAAQAREQRQATQAQLDRAGGAQQGGEQK